MSQTPSAGAVEPGLADDVWAKIAPVLPISRRKNRKGRPRMNDRQAMTAIWYKLQTGCSWKSLPRDLGAGSTIHDRYQEWGAAGVFDQLRQAGLLQDDQPPVQAAAGHSDLETMS